MTAVNGSQSLDMYRSMLRIRLFEEQVNELYTGAKMPGLAHLYIGEEGVAVGVCSALRDDDYITSTHRGHGHCLAKGASVDRMFAELLGKEAGYCRGKGGSMHIADQEKGNLGANAIVAGSVGIATGAALSAKKRGTDQVAACFFGEGALGQGIVYECMNMAALWKLPVIYVCENNMYNEYTHYLETTAGDIALRATAFGIPFQEADGQDVRSVYESARAPRSSGRGRVRVRRSCSIARIGSTGTTWATSIAPTTAPKRRRRSWKDRDPLKILAQSMVAEGAADAVTFDRLEEEVRTEISEGVKFALEAPYPGPEEVLLHVYAS